MKTITGLWQDGLGNAIAFGTLNLKLSQDAVVLGTNQVAPRMLSIALNSTGAIPAATQIVCNDEVSPSGTYYILVIQESGGGVVYGPQNYTIAGTSPINLNTFIPVLTTAGGSLSVNAADSVQNISTTQTVGFAGTVNTMIKATAGASGITLTLPSAVGVGGQTIRIIMIDTGPGSVTINTTGGQTISGVSNKVLSNQWQFIDMESDGANWIVTGSN